MSSISGLSSISVAQSGSSSGAHRGGHGKRLEDDLSSYLTQQGVSADDQKEIQSEIKDGLSSSSSGGRPDFSKLKDVVKQVLDKHGLSGDDFVSQMPSPSGHGGKAGHAGGPPPGPPPSDASSADSTSSTDGSSDSWLQKIVSNLSQNTASSTQSSNASSIKTALDSLDVNA